MRLVRHLTFSNVIALVALFVALGGAAYAGSKLNGRNIVNGSIGGGKLKNETITAKKIKKGTITGAQIKAGSITSTTIDVSTLATVPSAQTATTATSAQTAANAQNATQARTANTADTAATATTADDARHADEAGNAKHADEADQAKHADEADDAKHADEAGHATTAGDAATVEGKSAAELRAELQVGCTETTEFYGGMCWDKTTRQARPWLFAVKQCGEAGGRLPMIGELIAFVLRPDEQVDEQVWSGDVVDVSGTEEKVLTSDEHGREKTATGPHGYRCVFPLTN
ncbi:MAG TPA: hypothetical protein VMF55_02740 [Solirubrobacterales bacterium]|nr:hypothetical protein [Solirubrobacterales bacterium]